MNESSISGISGYVDDLSRTAEFSETGSTFTVATTPDGGGSYVSLRR
jgi:hypothetical protein